jgi:hypothetical protein
MSDKVMVRSSVQSWARTANIIGPWGDEVMSGITRSWDLVTAIAIAWQAVLGSVVWVLGGYTWSRDMVWVVWAGCWSTWVPTT